MLNFLLFFLHQEQASRIQAQLNEEELKNSKLLQEIAKLEEQVAAMTQESDRKDEVEVSANTEKCSVYFPLPISCFIYIVVQQFSTERSNWSKDRLTLQETVNNLQQSLQAGQQAAEG